MKDKESFHLDYYTQEHKIVHDVNKYKNIKEAMEAALKQFDKVNEKHSIRKLTIMTWKEAHEKAKRKQEEKE